MRRNRRYFEIQKYRGKDLPVMVFLELFFWPAAWYELRRLAMDR
jgi:hypothetical protein